VVSYSPRAAKALALLKRHYNDVDIFVEDTGNHNMWLFIARRLLPGVKIDSVNMLGGRDKVLQACKLDQYDTGRRKLYIIDGDFDFLLGRRKQALKFLYRLRGYCVENLLVSESALIQIGLETNPTHSEAQIASRLAYQVLMEEIERGLRPLFIAYAVCYCLSNATQTVKYALSKLIVHDTSGAKLDAPKIRVRIFSVLRAARVATGRSVVRACHNDISQRATGLPLSQIASGKDYLLPLIFFSFRARCGYKGSIENFKVALARSFDPGQEPYFARRMRHL